MRDGVPGGGVVARPAGWPVARQDWSVLTQPLGWAGRCAGRGASSHAATGATGCWPGRCARSADLVQGGLVAAEPIRLGRGNASGGRVGVVVPAASHVIGAHRAVVTQRRRPAARASRPRWHGVGYAPGAIGQPCPRLESPRPRRSRSWPSSGTTTAESTGPAAGDPQPSSRPLYEVGDLTSLVA